ncbi:helix-turn-helix transcriptional regulator [Nocardioides sp. CER19]|uniref:helix-turn-helix transcriptional regulator n=1 Tax=Nocardioides sp. CER19 TaxID=3038538 RepID=UPI00244C4A83|nr:helix-turn-helix transcriptional regulator [Nocardioides sp. CER19]MDH2413582.1 helix-turn-helix transcriptional regulator [Nocardioides sp. CER19]
MTTELGEFLRTRRAAISPDDAGLISYGARRVPGLRREELAMLAGVSPTYYTRLEQADQHNASDSVIDALARALRLSPEEHAHLRRLARPVVDPSRPPAEQARPSARALVHASPGPALIVDHSNDILAWNHLGHRLLAPDLPAEAPDRSADRPNQARMLFLEPGGSELYVDPDAMARAMVGFLRYSSGLFPDDRKLSLLVGELVQRSTWFASLWAEHPVFDCGYGVKSFRHPLVGRLDLSYEALVLAETTQRMVLYTAEPGSSSADGLELLGRD